MNFVFPSLVLGLLSANASAKLGSDDGRGLVPLTPPYRLACGACVLDELSCQLKDANGVTDDFTCTCPSDCPVIFDANAFACDFQALLGSTMGSFEVHLDDGTLATCKYEGTDPATCYRSCPRPAERKALCGACGADVADEIHCDIVDEAGVVNGMVCNCPDGDCATTLDCVATDPVSSGSFPIFVGDAANAERVGTCKPDPDDATELGVICAEEKCPPPATVECSDCINDEKTCDIVEDGAVATSFACTCGNCEKDVCDLSGIDLGGYAGGLAFPDGCAFSSDKQSLLCRGECITDNPTRSPTKAPVDQPTPCVATCGGFSSGTCCDGKICKANGGGRYSCKKN